VKVQLLGPLDLSDDDGRPVTVTGTRQRTALALLALRPGSVVSADRLIDDLWPSRTPQRPGNALQVVVSKLRRDVGGELIVTRPSGYLLAIDADAVDGFRFERYLLVGTAALTADRHEDALAALDAALALWRDSALLEFGDVPSAVAAATRWEELRANALEERFEALLEMGRSSELVSELDVAIGRSPFRERLRGQLMLALYRSGRQADALRAFADARHTLGEELGLDPGAELRRLEAAILSQDRALELPRRQHINETAVTNASWGTNLPQALTSFVGRAEDLRIVGELMESNRLVTLVGPGGAGKTRVAIEVARARLDRFADGVWFVALDTCDVGDDLAAAVTSAFGLVPADAVGQAAVTPVSHLDRARALLGDRDTLLVFDNCEHVIDEAARLVLDLLEAAPGLRLLTTSREALRVPGEAVWTIPPLEPADAARLFTDRAKAASPRSELGDGDRIAEVCARLDGMPLAIELCASRVNAFTVGQLAERLDDRFQLLLSGGSRTAVRRQQTLRAVIDWSYDLLFEADKHVFERLSSFAGSFSLEAAEVVCGDAELTDAREVDGIVGRLVDKSLVVADGSGRYRLLQTLAHYAHERLAERSHLAPVRNRHAAYYRELAARAFVDWRLPGGRDQMSWLSILGQEQENIRAAIDWSVAEGDGVTAQSIAGHVGFFWWHGGRSAEGAALIGRALRCTADTPPEVRGPATTWAAVLSLQAGSVEDAVAWAEDAVRLAPHADDPASAGMAYTVRSQLALMGGRVDETLADLARAAAEVEASRTVWGEAVAASLRASAATLSGQHAVAEREVTRSIAGLREVGDVCTLVLVLDQLSTAQEADGRDTDAEDSLVEALAVSRTHGLRGWQATTNVRLGSIARRGGNLGRARQCYENARVLGHDLALPALEAAALHGFGLIHRRAGRPDDALRCLRSALALSNRAEVWSAAKLTSLTLRATTSAALLVQIGYALELDGDLESCRRAHREALAAAERAGDERSIVAACEGLASAAAADRDGPLAACLLGYAAHRRDGHGRQPDDDEMLDIDHTRVRCQELLDQRDFEHLLNEGRASPSPPLERRAGPKPR
jgi:predicted ATPase/DNA-binding SARP family transcriptional activator